MPPAASSLSDKVIVAPPPAPLSPRLDPQLGGYPPDCGSKELKYLSYAKVLHDRGETHPMRYSMTEFDARGNAKPETYLLSTDFGAHSFHRLPTDSSVLSPYGVGMTLYFKYLKVMTWLFFLLVVLSAPALVIFIVGGTGSLAEFQMLAKQNFPMILGMTSIGHLRESSSFCDQVAVGGTLSLTCPAGEIGFVKAVYSTQQSQGSCSCPEINKVAAGSGKCRGQAVRSCSAVENCTTTCPSDGYGCFLGVHPVSKWACCATSLDKDTARPNLDGMKIRSTRKCGSRTIQAIVDGLCLGKKSCAMEVQEDRVYEWKVDEQYATSCPENSKSSSTTSNDTSTTPGTICHAGINDDSDYSRCPSSDRSLIVYARCFTTRIDLSNEWSLKIVGWDSISRQGFLGLAVGCDIACSVFFFLIVVWMKRKEQENVERITKDQIKALDYTVQLVHLPRHKHVGKLREEIRAHLETLLTNSPRYAVDLDRVRIADIQFGMNTSGHLKLLRNRGAVVRRLDVALQRYEKVRMLRSRLTPRVFELRSKRHKKKIQRLETKLMRHNARLDRWNAKHAQRASAQAVTAFITFEEEEGFNRCLQEYPDLGVLYRLFQPSRKRLHGERLRFRPAPDPSDIVWENLHHPFWERMLRQAIVGLITLAVLFVSFVLIFLAKLQKTKLEREFGRPTSCPAEVTKEAVVQDELEKQTGLVPYKALVECFCKSMLAVDSFQAMTQEAFFNPVTNRDEFYCKTWATSFIKTQLLSMLSVVMVVLVNVLLARILNVLVAMEKHHTESSQVVSRITKVFIAQFCNAALLMVVINANLSYFVDDQSIALSSFAILNGKYSDFTPAWYNDVGIALMLTMIINTFSPHMYVVVHYIAMEAKRFYDRGFSFDYSITRQDTQRDLDALYRGPKFDLAARYAQTLTSIFITYLFSAGMPLLHLVGFFAMLMTYWADKFTFLRIARSPPLYDRKVAIAAGSLLPYAVLLHSVVAMWMFSNAMIFQSPDDIASELASSSTVSSIGDGIPEFETVARGDIWPRLTRAQVVVLFAFFIVFCLVVALRILLFEYCPSMLQSVCPVLTRLMQKSKVAKGIPNYFDAIPTPILREKVNDPRVKPALRDKFQAALVKREPLGSSNSPKRRARRLVSAAEQYSAAHWIVGCPSYAISDNKEYVHELAIDSHLSEGISVEEIFCKDLEEQNGSAGSKGGERRDHSETNLRLELNAF
uniref:Anoctamin transmembrane domain-containing protein n=1 Tax=Globisporangium ultimum (strain ATCC 200006 / CBS 805.95 / DAOM BR144) TaxID=431595 RepID=K3WQ59_GLOUD